MKINQNYSYIIKTNSFDNFKKDFNDKKIYNINVNNCKSEKKIYEEIIKILDFPDCCGRNWDAIHDFIRDLSWLGEKQIIIVFKNYNNLSISNIDDRSVIFDILLSSVKENNERLDYKRGFNEPPIIIILEDCENNHKNIEFREKDLGLDNYKYIIER